jgi:diguanylate cyclase (GGDEF)-like protein
VIVGGPQLDAESLREELAARGLTAVSGSGADAQVAVVDVAGPEAAAFYARTSASLIVGVGSDAGLAARVDFTRHGGRTLLPAETSPAEIAEAVVALRAARAEQGTRILAVDDDPALLDLTATILHGHGLEVVALSEPSRFWQTLETRTPDVLLLDLEMPGFNGLELCRAVRADPRWGHLPILFLTARTDAEAVQAVLDAGADDYLTKPVAEEDLVRRIQSRLERVRKLRDLADRDALTGVASRGKASADLERLERIAKRYGQPLTLAMIDLDHFKRINDTYGHDTGDDVLRRLGRRLKTEFRGEDVVGRWGGEEFVVGMYGMPGELAVDRLTRLLDDWREERFDDPQGGNFTTSFTVGLAELPDTAGTLDELQQAADAALYRGKAAGRGRVAAAADRAAVEVDQVDIAVVDDDEALVQLLSDALSAEGWTVRALQRGPDAAEALAAEPPSVRARLVLLDWDLPGLDGLAVLDRLRSAGVLGRTQVVMVTARDDQADVLKALERGAADHVIKPFSLPVLLEKVRKLLQTR